jgi:chorismate mutase/prephenate dehydratase
MPDSIPEAAGDNLDVDISKLRRAIDEIDEKIMDLINRRLTLAQLIGRIKKQSGMGVTDRQREKEIINRLLHKNQGLMGNEGLQRIFAAIIAEGRSVQKRIER